MLNHLQELRNQHIGELRMLSRISRMYEREEGFYAEAERMANEYYSREYRKIRHGRKKPTTVDILIAFIVGWAICMTALVLM